MTRRYEPFDESNPADTVSSYVPSLLCRNVPTDAPKYSRHIRGINLCDHLALVEKTLLNRANSSRPPGARTRHLGIKSPLLYPMS